MLDEAANLVDDGERMVYVATFAVSFYASAVNRKALKPYNPVLGETYECIREDKGFRYISEKVSHHPTICACHAESRNFTVWGALKFQPRLGMSIEVDLKGKSHLILRKANSSEVDGDKYEWNMVKSIIKNVFSTKPNVRHSGEMLIQNTSNGFSCRVTINDVQSTEGLSVSGTVFDADNRELFHLSGNLADKLYVVERESADVIWQRNPMPEDSELYFGFTYFAMMLNELDEETAERLPPTDTRFRPDQRCLEEGNISDAEQMKAGVESIQRSRAEQRQKTGEEYVPKWFKQVEADDDSDSDSDENWVFAGEYWIQRQNHGFSNMTFEDLWGNAKNDGGEDSEHTKE